MRKTISSEPIVLNLPADQNLMLVIRLTAAGVIARAGVTVDRMDELKMAVEETCACLMEQRNPPRRIELCFRARKDALEIRADALDAEQAVGDTDADALEIITCIIGSLVDEVKFEVLNGYIESVEMRTAL